MFFSRLKQIFPDYIYLPIYHIIYKLAKTWQFLPKVEKTSKRGGKIISSDQIELQMEEEFQKEQQDKKSVTELLKNPTKVVCLRVNISLTFLV